MKNLLFILASLLLAVPCFSEIIIVDDDWPYDFETIQKAIDYAANGDYIFVFPGTYNEDISFNGKNVLLTSTDPNNPAATIIQGTGSGSVVTFSGSENETCVLRGLTITGGNTSGNGGGIIGYGTAAVITNCIVTDNVAVGDGGGLYGCSGEITNSTISNNTAYRGGGLRWCFGTISNCTISGNTADQGGGGISNSGTITDCIITNNSAMSGGGLSYCGNSINNCIISNNTASSGAGLYECHGTIINSIINNNEASNDGGGISGSRNGDIINCIIAFNIAQDDGGGIDGDNSDIRNTIIWGNFAGDQGDQFCSSGGYTTTLRTEYSCVQGGAYGFSNIDVDPLFVDANNGDFHLLPHSQCIDGGTNDLIAVYSLLENDLDGNVRPVDGDNDGTATSDIGVYESLANIEPVLYSSLSEITLYAFDQNIVEQQFVISNRGTGILDWTTSLDCAWLEIDPYQGSTNGSGDVITLTADIAVLSVGTYSCEIVVSDPCAINSPMSIPVNLIIGDTLLVPSQYSTIQGAIDISNDGDTIIVEPNTYYENINYFGKAIKLRSSDPDNWETVKSTIIDGDDDGSCVVFWYHEDRNSILEGFTLTNGIGSYSYYNSNFFDFDDEGIGGGIYCKSSSPTIRNCNVTKNGQEWGGAPTYGGGIALAGDCSANIINCFITDNFAHDKGPGIFIYGDYPERAMSSIVNCTIANNRSSSDQSKYEVECRNVRTTISNTIIWGEIDSLAITEPLLVTYSCIKSAAVTIGYDYDSTPYDPTTAGGNISGYPYFINNSYGSALEFGDYHLLENSSCIDAGDPCFDNIIQKDIDGQTRIMRERIDIGADEAAPTITVIKPNTDVVLISDSIHWIEWVSFGVDSNVDVSYSINGGVDWDVIEANVVDSGSYIWATPAGVNSEQCVVSVLPNNGDVNVISYDSGMFTIHPDIPGMYFPSRWETLGGGFDRAGLSGDVGPETGCVKWQFEAGGAVSAGITVGPVDLVHIGCEDGKVYTLFDDGTVAWIFDTNSPIVCSPTVGPDSSVYFGTQDGRLYALSLVGSVRWTHDMGGRVYSSVAIGEDGRVFAASTDGTLYALDHDGSELWSFQTSGSDVSGGAIFASPTIGADGTVYTAGFYDPNLYALDPNDGSIKWVCNFGKPVSHLGVKGGMPFASPVVGDDGTIYMSLVLDPNLFAINPADGNVIWATNLADPCSTDANSYYSQVYGDSSCFSEPALGADGTIYVSFDDPFLRAVDPNGSIKWRTRLGQLGGFTLTVAADGTIYAASDDKNLYVVDANGWEIARFAGEDWLSFPVITSDNTIIVSDSNNKIWAISNDSCDGQGPDLHWIADLNLDGNINFVDFAIMAADWLNCNDVYGPCGFEEGAEQPQEFFAGDIDLDRYVYTLDLAEIINRWLGDYVPRETRIPQPGLPTGWPHPEPPPEPEPEPDPDPPEDPPAL
ncbi:PQQ-binding-like beta-propeller repeat protein [Planctomycetota bacterium]